MNFINKLRSSICSWMESKISDIEIRPEAFTKASVILLSVLLAFSVILAFTACKPQQNLVDHSKTSTTTTTDSASTQQDSLKEKIVYVHDTVYLTKTVIEKDSSQTSQNSTSSITFGPQGGTYNSKTGEATNVQSVYLTEEYTKLQSSLKTTKTELQQARSEITALKDSISSLHTQYSSQQQTEQQNDISVKQGLRPIQQFFIYIGIIFLIIYVIRIILKFLQIPYPVLSVLNKILSWLP